MARLRALAVALLLATLVACEDEPQPDIADPTPSASTSTPSPTESSSTSSPTPEPLTPEETVRAWVEAQNLALRTGDTAPLRALSADGCQGCADYPDGIDAILDAGGHFEGGRWTLVKATIAAETATTARLDVAVRIAAGTTVSEAGAEPTVYAADSRLMTFELTADDTAWLISLIAFIS